MAFIKDWFRHEDNKTGCRFIVVDAYNEEKILRYYERNGFVPLYKTDVIEKQYYDIPQDEPLKNRLMKFDLKKYRQNKISVKSFLVTTRSKDRLSLRLPSIWHRPFS